MVSLVRRLHGCSDGGIIGDKLRTIIGHAEKTMNFVRICRCVLDKELDAGFVEFAFLVQSFKETLDLDRH